MIRVFNPLDMDNVETKIYEQFKELESKYTRNLMRRPRAGDAIPAMEEMVALYVSYANRTAKMMNDAGKDLAHVVFGMSGEVGEFQQKLEELIERSGLQMNEIFGPIGAFRWKDTFADHAQPRFPMIRELITHSFMADQYHGCNEEGGDALWYNALFEGVFKLPMYDPHLYGAVNSEFALVTTGVVMSSAEAVDMVKKSVVYGREVDMKKMHYAVQLNTHHWLNLYDRLGIPMSQVFAWNIIKLYRRYGDKYSDIAALARADKGGDQTTIIR